MSSRLCFLVTWKIHWFLSCGWGLWEFWGSSRWGGGLGGNRSFYNKSVLPLQSTCYCKPQRGCAAQLHPHLNSRKLCLAPEVTQRKEVRGGGTKPAWAFKATWECSGSLSTLAVIGKICIWMGGSLDQHLEPGEIPAVYLSKSPQVFNCELCIRE